jgi:hypothetical protein
VKKFACSTCDLHISLATTSPPLMRTSLSGIHLTLHGVATINVVLPQNIKQQLDLEAVCTCCTLIITFLVRIIQFACAAVVSSVSPALFWDHSIFPRFFFPERDCISYSKTEWNKLEYECHRFHVRFCFLLFNILHDHVDEELT